MASRKNSSKKAKTLEAMSTNPPMETQLRKREGGRGDPVGGGVFIIGDLECWSKPFRPCSNTSWFRLLFLFLEGPHVGNKPLDLVVVQAFGRLHQGFVVFLESFLDGFDGIFVFQRVLDFGIGIIRSEERRVGKECR